MNFAIFFVTLIVIIGLLAASKLQQPHKRRIHNLFIIAVILTVGGCLGLVNNLDSTTNASESGMWSNSFIWEILFAFGILFFSVASAVAFYLNVTQERQ